jgi:folate-binding protein YgfZ
MTLSSRSTELQSEPNSTDAQLAALLRTAAIAPLDDIGWIRVTGSDRLRWLNGMVTNSIEQLASGQGCYSFALNAQGQIQAELTAFLEPDSLLLETSRDQLEKLLAHLDHFIIMDDVELADITADRAGLLLAGPHAVAVLSRLNIQIPHHTPTRFQTILRNSAPLEIVHAHSVLVPRFEFWSNPAKIQQLTAEILAAGVIPVSAEALDQLRILEGTPRYGTDITDRNLPQETSQISALHFSKGCYIGQEIVERIHSRGSVHRALTGLVLTGALPERGITLESEGKPAGELTSVASIQLPDHAAPTQLALGIIRREALDRSLPLTYPGGTATPVTLPYDIRTI